MDYLESSPGTSSDMRDTVCTAENDLTNKFLSGEMSFAEYSSEWYNADDEDDAQYLSKISELSDEESKETPAIQPTEKSIRRRRGCLSLTPALMGLMGEANLRFVRGDKEMAEKMCHEIIKQAPTAAEPYQTLSQIYEDDAEKCLQFALLAAHLSRPDANEWLRLAAISHERKDYRQEMICYTHAINANPTNLGIHLKRLELYDFLDEIKYPMHAVNFSRVKAYHKIVNSLPPSEGETILKYARLAATLYNNNKESERSLDVMASAYKKCSNLFTLENTNILLELLITNKQYQTCLEIFVANVGVEIEAEIETIKNTENTIEEHTNYLKCTIPDNLPIDFKSKLLVCFIYLGAVNLVQTLLHDFLTNDVEKAGDLYMDIEEALSSVGYHELAMKLLEPLVRNTSFDLGAVWLKHAECLYNLGREDDAVESYYKVLKHAPQHPDARRKLFGLLEKKGCIDEALDILQQDYKYVVSASLLHEQCIMLKKYNKQLKYLEVGEALLSKTFARYRHPGELKIAFRTKSSVELIHSFRSLRGENTFLDDDIHFDEDDQFKFSPQEEWELFTELLQIALQYKKYYVMQRLCFGAVMSKHLAPHRLDLEFLCFQACLLNKDYQNAMRFIREFAQKYSSSRAWSLLSYVLNALDECAHIKFLYRLFQKDNNVVKNIFLGNNFLISGRYLVALKYYREYHEQCREPISALLIGIISLVMVAPKIFDKHHNLILQGIGYMFAYQKLRKCDQETYYNIGRAYHMLNINNLAIEYYEKALNSEPIATCEKHGVIELRKEIAYNLFFLYKKQSPEVARTYLNKYLVIE